MIQLDNLKMSKKMLILLIIGILGILCVGYIGITSSGTINAQLNELYEINKVLIPKLSAKLREIWSEETEEVEDEIGENKPIRVQGAFISEEEVENVVDFIKDSEEEVATL